MKDVIKQIIDDNQDLIDLQQQKADLLPKECETCGRDLSTWTQAQNESVGEDEYITMMSISDEHYGGVGGLSYYCQPCLEHTKEYHSIFGVICKLGSECPFEKYSRYKKDRKDKGD